MSLQASIANVHHVAVVRTAAPACTCPGLIGSADAVPGAIRDVSAVLHVMLVLSGAGCLLLRGGFSFVRRFVFLTAAASGSPDP